MHVFEAIETRRSVKHYDPDHRMSDEEVRRLLELAILSPTSFNIQNWRFVVVRDPALRAELRAAAWNQAQVTDASLLLVLCADLAAHDHDPERYWRTAPPETAAMLAGMIRKFYTGQPQLQRDEALRSTGLAAQTIMLAARAMGLDSCPMVGFDPVRVAEAIRLPPDHMVSMMITVGRKLKDARPRGGQLPLDEVVVTDRFS